MEWMKDYSEDNNNVKFYSYWNIHVKTKSVAEADLGLLQHPRRNILW